MADVQEPRSLPTEHCCEGAPEAMGFRRHTPFSRRAFLKLVALSGVGLLAQDDHGPTSSAQCARWAEADTIRRRIKPPSFPQRTFAITCYGAVLNGSADSTGAIRA